MKSTKDRHIVLDVPGGLSPIAALADIPEDDIWLAKQKTKRTRRAYKLDMTHFMWTLMILSYEELRQVDHHAIIAWERIMREIDGAAPSTVRAGLRRSLASSNILSGTIMPPVSEVERPAINREEGSTLAFSRERDYFNM